MAINEGKCKMLMHWPILPDCFIDLIICSQLGRNDEYRTSQVCENVWYEHFQPLKAADQR